jgi:hypothetical protein
VGTAWTDPGLVDRVPGAGPPVPFSPDPPFVAAFAFKAMDPGPIDILRACGPGFTIAIGTRGCEPIMGPFGLPFGGAVARIGGGGSTLHIMGTGPLAVPNRPLSARISLDRGGIVAIVVAVAVLVEEGL